MPNEILLITTDKTLALRVDQGPIPPRITSGFGGWQIVARPRKTGLVQFQGRQPYEMLLNFMFDGWADGISQEHKLRILTWMSLPPNDGDEPRPINIYGALPFPSGGEWVINNIEYDAENVIWDDSDGSPVRLRQLVNVTLLQHIKADRVSFAAISQTGLAPIRPKVYVTKANDTLRSLAQRFLGDATRWREIADANGIHDPTSLLPNTHLRIP